MLGVVLHLHLAPPFGLADGAVHRLGTRIGVHDDVAVDVAGRAPDCLDQRAIAAQVALLVGVEDGDESHFGQIETFAQEVDANQDVELTEPQVAQDVNPLQGLDVGVQVVDPNPRFAQVIGQVFRHALGQRRDQRAIAPPRLTPQLGDEVVDLPRSGAYVDSGVDQPGGPDQLLHHLCRTPLLEVARCRRHVEHLADALLPLVEVERPVVERRRQAEAVLHQWDLARAVAAIHAAELGDANVALVDDDEGVLGQVVHQGVGCLAGLAAGEMARVVFDAGAGARLAHHLEVEKGALSQALRFQQTSLSFEPADPLLELLFDRRQSGGHLGLAGDVLARGE